MQYREITEVAISDKTLTVAFIVKQSFVDSGEIRYGLYVCGLNASGSAKKLVEAAYLKDLSLHPRTELWTVRGDFGAGVQLYDVDGKGTYHPLAVHSDMVNVGAFGDVISPVEGARDTGIVSYQWAPDGSALWYSAFRLRRAAARQELADQGVVYDGSRWFDFRKDPTKILGIELHVLNHRPARDRIIGFLPTRATREISLYRKERGVVFWDSDSRHIYYASSLSSEPKAWTERAFEKRVTDITSGETRTVGMSSLQELLDADASRIKLLDGGYLTLHGEGGHPQLVKVGANGDIKQDYGKVSFRVNRRFGAWQDESGGLSILGVRYEDRDGLIILRGSQIDDAFTKIQDNLSHCVFTKDLSIGVAVRESLTTAA